jgi:hypothetical protein
MPGGLASTTSRGRDRSSRWQRLPASALGRGRTRVDDPPMQHAPARLVLALAVAVAVVAGAAAPAHAKPDAKQAKVNVYIDVLNQWSSYVYKQRDDYAAWVDLRQGPRLQGEQGPRPQRDRRHREDQTFPGYLKALKKGPKLPVDAAAMKMVTTLQALWQPTADASEYYYKRQWKDDDCKRGRSCTRACRPVGRVRRRRGARCGPSSCLQRRAAGGAAGHHRQEVRQEAALPLRAGAPTTASS